MDLLRAALTITESIPPSRDYKVEREFCWLAVGKAGLAVGDDHVFERALDALGEQRLGAELRLAALRSNSTHRRDILADFLDRLAYWEKWLWRSELGDLATAFGEHFSVVAVSSAAGRIDDPFTRTSMLVRLADGVRDPVMKASLLRDARDAAAEVVDGDGDYALKHVVSGCIRAGLLDEASDAVDAMEDPEIRLDYLERLRLALEKSGRTDQAESIAEQRGAVTDANPDARPQSETIAEARALLEYEIDPDHPSDRSVFKRIAEMMAAGAHQEAIDAVKERFLTRVCPAVLDLTEDELASLLLLQLERVHAYRRNDLKVEFLTDLAREFHARNKRPFPAITDYVSSADFLPVAPAALPSIHAIDPSSLSFDEFVKLLFDRPVAETEEESRILERERDDDPEIADPANLVRLSTELFLRFGEIAPRFSPEQVDQGLWDLLGYPYGLHDVLDRGGLSAGVVLPCVRAAYHVFADYVARHEVPDSATKFNMWWDEFWYSKSPEFYAALVETMTNVLELPDEHSRYAALHGLGHLVGRGSPAIGVPEAIRAFLARRRDELTPDLAEYAEYAARGEVM